MMKKTLKLIFSAVLILSVAILTLGSCDFDISEPLDKHVCIHEWSDWDIVEQGDCKNPGLIRRECEKCGAVDEENTVLKEHTESDWIVDRKATCTKDGSKHTKCTVCDKTLSTEKILATGEHIESDWIVDKEATCTEDGSKHTKCTVCGKTLSIEKILASGEHIESDWIVDKEATCTEDGSKHTKCTVCGITISIEKIPATEEHKYENYNCVVCGLTSEECFEFTYLPESDSYEIKANKNCDLPNEISLPSSYDGKPVTSIGSSAFSSCNSLTSIEIPDSVTSIGSWAFSDCSSLTCVWISNSVTSIYRRTFFNCSNLISINITDSITSIGDEAFLGCSNLTNVVIGNSVASISKYAFNFCLSLTDVYYNGTLEEWKHIDIYRYDGSVIMIGNSSETSNFSLTNATRYYYSEARPDEEGNFWHWGENGEVVIWE